ncbi:hypothetical protein B9G69_015795 [Bdellovibrio sp. SKB1291214]|uniref:hypothetical protein n=1 Tax=Bdellovibrio sp. SKB1291214 TaxID=1732569 RepID=UPI000B517151|nr:hypothetical protein [Bdellovibrio sp. SKB1291214]UYL08506.1 hypothetical protein B9G69_015795 [Bdellovibrio sp. SKB1291214]
MKSILEADAEKALAESQKNFKQDFSTSRGFFTEADEISLREMALAKLDEELAKTPSPCKSADDVRKSWNAVVTDFHRNNYWNFQPTAEKRPRVLTQDQKTFREMFPYVWAVIQSGIVLKTAVYYFGIRSSSDPSTENHIFLYLALATSAGTLIFFAWKNFHKN